MELEGLRIGFAITGSHCTYQEVWPQIERLASLGADIYPIASKAAAFTDTRFGRGEEMIKKFEQLTGKTAIIDFVDAEPIGPRKLLDLMVIAPCSGNTAAKLANAITDTAVTMAAKAVLRNGRPLVLAISTNDGLGMNAKNIGVLLNTRNIFFVPFGQDNPEEKPNSLVADMNLLIPAIAAAVSYRQLQPILIERTVRHAK